MPRCSGRRIGGIGGKGREAKGRERPTETGTGIESGAMGEGQGHPIDGGGMARWGKAANQSRCELAKGNREASPPLRIQAAGDYQAIAASHPTGPGKGRPGSEDWQGCRGMAGGAGTFTFTTFTTFIVLRTGIGNYGILIAMATAFITFATFIVFSFPIARIPVGSWTFIEFLCPELKAREEGVSSNLFGLIGSKWTRTGHQPF